MSSLPVSFKVMYWGVVVSTALFGITVLQGWIYLHNNRDPWLLRGMVSVMIIVDFITAGLIGGIGSFYFVDKWGLPNSLASLPQFISGEPFVVFPMIYVVQLFFASRVRMLNRNSWIAPTLIVSAATAAFVAGIVIAVDMYMKEVMSVFLTHYMEVAIGLHTGLSAFSDITATIFLTAWSVSNLNSCFKSSNHVLKNLVGYIVTRGFLLVLVQLGTCIIYLVLPGSLYWTPFHLCKGRVYAITMLSILNSRETRREIERRESVQVREGKDTESMIFVTRAHSSTANTEAETRQTVDGHRRPSHPVVVFVSKTQPTTSTTDDIEV